MIVSKSVWVDVEVGLDEFDTDDLVAELDRRDKLSSINSDADTIFEELYDIKRYRPELFDEAFSKACWTILGKNV